MKKNVLAALAVILVLGLALLVTGCGGDNQTATEPEDVQVQKLKVVTTTSLIADIVKAVGEDRVEVSNIIPPASCPGHFDAKPSDMQVLANAKLFMLHNWQSEKFSDELINSVGNKELQKVVLDVKGNWMAPPVHMAAIDKITASLIEADPENAEAYNAAAAELKEEVERIGQEQKRRLEEAGVSNVKVLVADMQAGFIKWTGLDIVGTFGRAEDMSPKEMEELINLGREKGVTLVIDNLQSGKEAGIGIAKEIGAKQVTLSNFPGGFPGTDTWADAFTKNVDLILKTLGR
ncbi:MAG: zinc ABC transporter substrate-binding protein [Peptococcaceae bacterium]|nr:zinc ABC transporter substrate-binding protein [Peptococcaceae bacterium]